MKNRKIARSILLAAAVLIGVSALGANGREAMAQETEGAATQSDAVTDTRIIREGIRIGDVDLGNMSGEQATAAVREYVEGIGDQTVTLAVEDLTMETTVTELGFQEDVDATIEEALNYGNVGNLLKRYKQQKDLEVEDKVLPLALFADEEQVETFLEEHLDELNREPVDYGLTRVNGEFVIEEGATGLEVNVEESANVIREFFASGWQEDAVIELEAEVTEPKGSLEELSLVQDVLGKYSTDYSSSASGRKQNVATGAAYIDGTLLYPGEQFSMEPLVAPLNEENGYALASSYENGTTVDSYGGGICQVSTTLYNAAIRAELQIDVRYGHSMLVDYVPASADAAYSEGLKNLEFTNNTDAPIYISAYTDGATITFTIYGHETRPANREVSFESETTGTTDPETEYKASDAAFGTITKVQSSHTGKTARLWKIVKVNGVEESRTVFNTTTYRMSPTIYEVGTSTNDAEAKAALEKAIKSGDRDQIDAVIYDYNHPKAEESTTKEKSESSSSSSGETGAGDSSDTESTG